MDGKLEVANAEGGESEDRARVPGLSIVSLLPYGIVLSRQDEERVGSSDGFFDRSAPYTASVASWGGSRGVVALKKTTVESRPVSRVGPSGGRETF